MNSLIKVMKALSDPNRVRALKLLEKKALCVCEIQFALGLAQSTVSKHMKILEDAGLVDRSRLGTWIMYSLADKAGSCYADSMLAHLKEWLNDDVKLLVMHEATSLQPDAKCYTKKGIPGCGVQINREENRP